MANGKTMSCLVCLKQTLGWHQSPWHAIRFGTHEFHLAESALRLHHLQHKAQNTKLFNGIYYGKNNYL